MEILLEVVGAFACIAFGLLVLNFLKNILETLNSIVGSLKPIKIASSIEFLTLIDGQFQKVTHMFLKVNQNLPVAVVFKDKFGNLATVDGKPTWAVTAPELATLEVADDAMSAKLIPVGTVGSLKVQVSADADMGAGVTTILGELSVDLVAGEALSVEVTAGTPEDQA